MRRALPKTDAGGILDALVLHRVTPDVLRRAARLTPASLRRLDAIHLASALGASDGDTRL